MKVLVSENNLTNIANAIRGKNGTTTTYKPSEMAAAITAISGGGEPTIESLNITSNGTYTAPEGIDGYSPVTVNVPQDGSPPESAFVISGVCSQRFQYNMWNWFIEQYSNKITTENIGAANGMFTGSDQLYKIPFELNFDPNSEIGLNTFFQNCSQLIEIPKFNNCKVTQFSYFMAGCNNVRELPVNFWDGFNWNFLDNTTLSWLGGSTNMFNGCSALRKIPTDYTFHMNKSMSYSNSYFYNGFFNCHCLDELTDLAIPYTATWTSNAFYETISNNYRLKSFTFYMPDGQPYVKNWKNQTISFHRTGYSSSKPLILNYNSGITADKEVTDDTTYQELKNDPDWFTINKAYSRYNHDSAVATINSLPDTSAYLASAGGTNTIKFEGTSGSATDGGAINTLTEAEIAVATAKGWTVSLV